MEDFGIMHECGNFWVRRHKDMFHVMQSGKAYSITDSVHKTLDLAIARCNDLAAKKHVEPGEHHEPI